MSVLETARPREDIDYAPVSAKTVCWDQIPSCEALKWTLSAHIYLERTLCKLVVLQMFCLPTGESYILLPVKWGDTVHWPDALLSEKELFQEVHTAPVLISCCSAADILFCVPEYEIAICISSAWKRWKRKPCLSINIDQTVPQKSGDLKLCCGNSSVFGKKVCINFHKLKNM